MKKFQVLFVCMGNICRSPTAHGVFRQKVQKSLLADVISVDSAGTHNYHPNEPPDRRSQAHALARGIDISDLRARQITDDDFEKHDLILVMDWENLSLTEYRCPEEHRHKIRRLTEFCIDFDHPVVPDPYYGGKEGFEEVLDLIEDACSGLLTHLEMRVRKNSANN